MVIPCGRGCIPGGAHSPDVLARKAEGVCCRIVVGPSLDLRFVHKPTSVHHLGKTPHDSPPRRCVGHCEIVAFLAARDRFFLQDLLHDDGIKLGQVGDVCCRRVLSKHRYVSARRQSFWL